MPVMPAGISRLTMQFGNRGRGRYGVLSFVDVHHHRERNLFLPSMSQLTLVSPQANSFQQILDIHTCSYSFLPSKVWIFSNIAVFFVSQPLKF